MTVTLSLKETPELPLEADSITPTHFAGKTIQEMTLYLVFIKLRRFMLQHKKQFVWQFSFSVTNAKIT